MTEYKLALTTRRCCKGSLLCERHLIKGLCRTAKQASACTHPRLSPHKTASSKLYLTPRLKAHQRHHLKLNLLTHANTQTFHRPAPELVIYSLVHVCISIAEGLLDFLLSSGSATSPEENTDEALCLSWA